MFGRAYFVDGHTEPITSYSTNPIQSELYFTTESGTYGFKSYVPSPEYEYEYEWSRAPLLMKHHSFYKCCDSICHWFVTSDIEYIEIYTEVLHNG